MAHPHEDLVRRAYDAFSQGDIETLRQLFGDWRRDWGMPSIGSEGSGRGA
jgi:hypothetical protein